MFTKIISMFLKPKQKDDTTFPERQIVHYSEPKKVFIPAKQITGILGSDKPYFWNRKGNKKGSLNGKIGNRRGVSLGDRGLRDRPQK